MLIPSTCAERAIRNVGERAFLRTRSLLGFASGRLKDVMRSAPSMQAPGALIAYSRMAQSLPHSAVVHAARESIRTAATLTQRSRRYTQRFSVLSEAVTENARILNGGGEEERTSKSNIKTWGGKTTKGREYRAEFSVLAKRSRKTRAIFPDWVVIGWL